MVALQIVVVVTLQIAFGSGSSTSQGFPPPRPFSKKGVGYYGGTCDDFATGGLDNISWFYDWCVARVSRFLFATPLLVAKLTR